MEREEISILVSGGCICFFGDWFGRPYDNFHEIKSAEYKDNTLTIEFSGGEKLIVSSPENIKNEKKNYIYKRHLKSNGYIRHTGENIEMKESMCILLKMVKL